MQNLVNKKFLLTGATSGIGKAIAQNLDYYGAELAIISRKIENINQLSNSLKKEPFKLVCNLKNPDSIHKVFQEIDKLGWKFDGFIHSAGINSTAILKDSSINDIRDMMDINCFSFVEICKYFCSKRYSQNGAVVLAISSMSGLVAEKGKLSYSMSKAALNCAIKIIAQENIKRRIRVNGIAPVYVKTAMLDDELENVPGLQMYIDNSQPFGCIEIQKVVDLSMFLISESSSYITGEIIPMNAGGYIF